LRQSYRRFSSPYSGIEKKWQCRWQDAPKAELDRPKKYILG
jgi:hypothetical protein